MECVGLHITKSICRIIIYKGTGKCKYCFIDTITNDHVEFQLLNTVAVNVEMLNSIRMEFYKQNKTGSLVLCLLA